MAKRDGEHRSDVGWLNPLNKLAFQKAVRADAEVCKTPQGTYLIQYFTRENGTEIVHIKIEGATAPNGFFEKKKLLGKLWLIE